MKNAKILIEEITRMFPPGMNQRHALSMNGACLTLYLLLGDRYLPIYIADRELERDIYDLIDEISDVILDSLKSK